MTVCQLHGGDIGVSSKEGDGSTFGFFFKVRRSNGSNEDGRPPLASRSNSGNPATPIQRAQAPRPGYSRSNSHLPLIKERTNEQGQHEVKLNVKENDQESKPNKDAAKGHDDRPGLGTLTSHTGVDVDDVDSSLKNPPTEYFPESHPKSAEDHRYHETEGVANTITPPVEGHDEEHVSFSETGETERQEAAARKAHKAQGSQRWEDKRSLLLVEDNLINQKVLRRQLQARGFEVFVANNGQEAIDAVAERGQFALGNQYNRNYFDCILMDQEMPIKDGNQATAEIRQLQDEGKAGYSKVLGVSANVREAQRSSMREAGMDDLISKPFRVDDLIKKINELTIGGEDGRGGDGKLTKEAKQGAKNIELMKGEKETKEKDAKENDLTDKETDQKNTNQKETEEQDTDQKETKDKETRKRNNKEEKPDEKEKENSDRKQTKAKEDQDAKYKQTKEKNEKASNDRNVNSIKQDLGTQRSSQKKEKGKGEQGAEKKG